jgi:hypothetical protein
MTLFEVSEPKWTLLGGTVTGGEHRRALKNNQDGLALSREGAWCAAVVTDGCSSGRSSEVGARLGAAWLAQAITRAAPRASSASGLAEEIAEGLASWLRGLVAPFPEERHAALVAEMLLFSFLAAVVGPERAIVFGIGDGVVARDGVTTALPSGPDNAPPYAAYALIGAPQTPIVHVDVPCDEVRSLLVATDGALDLERRAEELLKDGLPQGGLDPFATDAGYAKNPSLVQKRLTVIGEVNGRLPDDTTIAVIRRGGGSWT